MDCKFSMLLIVIISDRCSIDNDDKLREKVDEALTVYDEYVKSAGEMASIGQEADGKIEEAAPEAEPEPINA